MSAMSAPETINTRHSLTGQIQRVTPAQLRVFKDWLQPVADDAKPYQPGMFKPGKVGEFDNPEPPTDAEEAAQAQLDAVLEDNAPNSKAAREAKAAAKAAEEAAQNSQDEAAKAAEAATEGDA